MATTIATKADLQLLEQKLAARMDLIRKDIEIQCAKLEMTMTVRLGSMLIVSLGILFAAVKLT